MISAMRSVTDVRMKGLAAVFGDRLETRRGFLDRYSADQSGHAPVRPDAVIQASSPEDVARAVTLCGANKIPVVAWGAGTSMEGNSIPVMGGLVVDMTPMQSVLEVNPLDMDCLVEAGLDRLSLDRHLRDSGLFFPVDPGAPATLGGMAATGASGTMTMMYGSMRENVMGLEVVLSNGDIIETGGRARKSSAGYDLTRVFVGSEGTLGLITKLRLKLHPVPEAMMAACLSFESIDDAVASVLDFMQLGLPLARCELADEVQMAASIAFSKLSLPAVPTLFLEFHGGAEEMDSARSDADDVAAHRNCTASSWSSVQEERSRIWQARHDAGPAGRTIKPWTSLIITDVAVPVSALPDCIAETKRDLADSGLTAPLIGHVGDGNFHLTLLVDDDSSDAAERFNERLIDRAIRFGGTCSGEHGIGLGKRKFLRKQHGPAVDAMARLKACFDPDNILNPGKIFE